MGFYGFLCGGFDCFPFSMYVWARGGWGLGKGARDFLIFLSPFFPFVFPSLYARSSLIPRILPFFQFFFFGHEPAGCRGGRDGVNLGD